VPEVRFGRGRMLFIEGDRADCVMLFEGGGF
jgi:hypothetical protein